MKHFFFLILLSSLFAACVPLQPGPSPTPSAVVGPTTSADVPVTSETPVATIIPNPYAPQPGDDNLARASTFVTSSSLLAMDSFPPQIELILSGAMPTPCHSLRAVVHEPDSANNIDVEVYSVANGDKLCDQVLQSFDATIPLGAYPPGHYTVSVNGALVGDFNS